MTTVLEPLEEIRVASPEDFCHFAPDWYRDDAVNRREHVAFCGAVLDEGPCCEPGFPNCGRPKCPECQMRAREAGEL